jgi:hypothetical protein
MIFFIAGCDDDDDGSPAPDPDPDPPMDQLDVVEGLYDTTESEATGETIIEVSEFTVDGNPGIIEGGGEGEVTWTSDFTYILDGRNFVNAGQTLNIEPGTVIKGRPRTDPTLASVLIVAQDGTINADGTADQPIIWTTEDDDVTDPNDLPENLDRAWGGLIVLGNAPTNTGTVPNVEGIPTDEARGAYGGDDADDSSGILRYISIRYGGVSIGAGNEINGLTLGGVGAGTTVEHVEVYNNLDDGIEWFGGTVNGRYLVTSRNGDDSFDIDQGFSGSLQYLLAIQTPGRGDRTAEHDGGSDSFAGEDATPFADPQIYNATYVGSGPDGDGDIALKLRDNFAGNYFNSIFYSFPAQLIEVEDVEGTDGDSRGRWEADDLTVENSIHWQFGAAEGLSDPAAIVRAIVENDGDWGDQVATDLIDYNNSYEDPGLTRDLSGDLQTVGVIPPTGSPADGLGNGSAPPDNGFFDTSATYRGAFEPGGENWASWTFSAEKGLIQ